MTAVSFEEKADVYLINTCSVTNMADKKSRHIGQHLVMHLIHSMLRAIRRSLSVCAPLCVAETEEDLQKNYNPGDIIVMKETSNNIMEQLKTASAIVCEKDGKNSHAAIVGLSRDVPVIIGAKNATQILKTGAIVTVKAKDGVVVS